MICERIKRDVSEPAQQCSVKHQWNDNWSAWYKEARIAKAKARGFDPTCCIKGAQFRIFGQIYCKQHTGPLLVGLVMGDRRDKRVREAYRAVVFDWIKGLPAGAQMMLGGRDQSKIEDLISRLAGPK